MMGSRLHIYSVISLAIGLVLVGRLEMTVQVDLTPTGVIMAI